MSVILPEADRGLGVDENVWDGVEPLPVLYLLHGMSDNHTIWMRRTAIDRYAAGRKLAIVMPSCGRSYYANQVFGLEYQRFIGEELPQICRRFFRISDKREDNFIAGLSMGGYGALKIALNYPDRFSYCASMSGVLDLGLLKNAREYEHAADDAYLQAMRESDYETYRRIMDIRLCFGTMDGYRSPENNLIAALESCAARGVQLPELYLSIGRQDYLYETNVPFRAKLDALKIPYRYEEFDGRHEWAVWDKKIQDVLDWLPVQSSKPTGNGEAERIVRRAD